MKTSHTKRALILLSALLATQTLQAAEFKCFVQANDGRKHVVFAVADSLSTAQQMMQDAHVAGKKKGEVGLSRIMECAAAEDAFTSAEARKVEETMPW